MQPLLITSLVALLIALIKLKIKIDELVDAEYKHKYWHDVYKNCSADFMKFHAKYDAQVNLVNKLQVDNALLVASLKRKHLRVPKL